MIDPMVHQGAEGGEGEGREEVWGDLQAPASAAVAAVAVIWIMRARAHVGSVGTSGLHLILRV